MAYYLATEFIDQECDPVDRYRAKWIWPISILLSKGHGQESWVIKVVLKSNVINNLADRQAELVPRNQAVNSTIDSRNQILV